MRLLRACDGRIMFDVILPNIVAAFTGCPVQYQVRPFGSIKRIVYRALIRWKRNVFRGFSMVVQNFFGKNSRRFVDRCPKRNGTSDFDEPRTRPSREWHLDRNRCNSTRIHPRVFMAYGGNVSIPRTARFDVRVRANGRLAECVFRRRDERKLD